MKTITLCLAFTAWIQCTKSYEFLGRRIEPTPQSSEAEQYTQIIKESILESLHPSGPNHPNHPRFGIWNRDKIIIYKVINGHFAPFDAVKGFLKRTPVANHDRELGHPPIIEDQHGEVEVRLGGQNFLFHAALRRMPAYEDHGVDSGRAKYFCTIERGLAVYLAGILVNSEQLHVPDNVERVLFVNHLYRNPGDILYQGQLFEANPVKIRELFDSL